MRKLLGLLSLALLLSCACLLCGCEKTPSPVITLEDDIDTFTEALEISPASVTTVITILVDEDTTLTAATLLSGDARTVTYQQMNRLSLTGENTAVTTETTESAKTGENTVDLTRMVISRSTIKNWTVKDGVLTGTIQDPSAFFGTEITSFTGATVRMTLNEAGAISLIEISYETNGGRVVTLTATAAY